MNYPDEIIALAYEKQNIPKDLNPPEKFLYLAMRHLYGLYEIRAISKDEASEIKRELLKDFSGYIDTYKKYMSTIREPGHLIKDSEEYRIKLHHAFNANKTDLELLQIACECIYKLTNDRTILCLKDWNKYI